jgi:thiamine biosynthesis lipoprotein
LRLDLGGIAKGFAVDQAVRSLKRAGVAWGLVNAGGDLRAFGSRAWPIHVRHPAAPGQLIAVGTLREGAVATSAPYFSERMQGGQPTSALFDPTTERSIVAPISATVFARTCLFADALTKAVLLGDASPALRACRAHGFVLTAEGAARDAA